MMNASNFSAKHVIATMFLFLGLALLLTACSSTSDSTGSKSNYTYVYTICSNVTQPVCGTGHSPTRMTVTYRNVCELRNNHSSLINFGVCANTTIPKNSSKIPFLDECGVYTQVMCGLDGNTYLNKCYADRSGVGINYTGDCLTAKTNSTLSKPIPGTLCPNTMRLVCGSNGLTYQNECLLGMDKVTVAKLGSCFPLSTTLCKDNVRVCGVDGKTYASKCVAADYNVSVDYNGACKAK